MTRRTAGLAFAPALALGLALGCAAAHDEELSREADFAGEAKDAPVDAAFAEEPTPEAQAELEPAGPPAIESLDDAERELAANEAKLRALGVEPRAAGERGEEKQETTATKTKTKTSKKTKRADKQPASPSGGGAPRPASPPSNGGVTPTPKQDASVGSIDGDGVAPEEAKAKPLSPNSTQQDAATRCMSICDLSQITCDLSAQVCELADRHTEDEDYKSACERAVEDCEVAQEACNVCQ